MLVASPETSVTRYPFSKHELVLTHIPDPSRGGAVVPVSGVVVTPGALTSTIRIRNLEGKMALIVVLNRDLVGR
jgi:hypothetical protein